MLHLVIFTPNSSNLLKSKMSLEDLLLSWEGLCSCMLSVQGRSPEDSELGGKALPGPHPNIC